MAIDALAVNGIAVYSHHGTQAILLFLNLNVHSRSAALFNLYKQSSLLTCIRDPNMSGIHLAPLLISEHE
jgi:hypothetical protein